jgi:type IV fimbrial biogenesis protein FimT
MRARCGFTILELLIVLAILGITFGFAIQRWPTEQIAMDQAVRQVASTVRLARFEAIKRNEPVRVHFDGGASTLRVSLPKNGEDWRVRPLDTRGGERIRVASDTATLTFNARGIATVPTGMTTTIAHHDGQLQERLRITQQGIVRRESQP